MSDVFNLFVCYMHRASPFEGGSAKGIPLGGDDFQQFPSQQCRAFSMTTPLQPRIVIVTAFCPVIFRSGAAEKHFAYSL